MVIAVNTRLLLKNKLEGIGWFTYEVLTRICTNHPEHQFIFIFDRPFSQEFIFSNNIKPIVVGPPARHPFLWYYWFEHQIPRVLKRHKADVFVSPDGYISLSTSVPQLSVIHDINFYHSPEGLPFFTSKYLNYFFPRFAHKANRIVTVSHFSKQDIVANFGVLPEKIDVAHNGASNCYKPLGLEEVQSVRDRISDGKPYFIFVGAFNPRKNVARLIHAFDHFKTSTASGIKLVLVGEPMFKTSDIDLALKRSPNRNDITLLGRKGIDELPQIVGAALAMVYPSTFEGFGIPLLEAMKCGIPIAASNATAIPEVTGDAAIYFDPFSTEEIANAMVAISTDDLLRQKLSTNALEQQKKFSWDSTAITLFSSIEKCIG